MNPYAARQKLYYQQHRPQILRRMRRYRLIHKTELDERGRVYRVAHRDQAMKRNRMYYAKHQKSMLIRSRLWRQAHLKHIRDYMLRHKFGISLAQYDTLLQRQKGVCAICGQSSTRRTLDVDHDHKNGRVRGLLCSACNTGIGLFHDDPDIFVRIIKYLS